MSNNRESNMIWRSFKSGIASGVTGWSLAYIFLSFVSSFGIALGIPIPVLAVDLCAAGIALVKGGQAGHKRYKDLQTNADEKESAEEALEQVKDKIHALREKINTPSNNEALNKTPYSEFSIENNTYTTKWQFFASKSGRSFKAFIANLPAAQTTLFILLGISFLPFTPVGWVIIASGSAAGLAWGITAAVKKWQTVSANEKFAQEYQKNLDWCKHECALMQEKLNPEQIKQLDITNNPTSITENSLAAGIRNIVGKYKAIYEKKGLITLLDDSVDFVNEVVITTFYALVDTIKQNIPILGSGFIGAATGFAITKAAFAIGLPLLLAIGFVAPPSLVITGIAVVTAVIVGFAIGKAKQIHLKQVENIIDANKKSLENLNNSIKDLEEKLVEQISIRNGCKLPEEPKTDNPEPSDLKRAVHSQEQHSQSEIAEAKVSSTAAVMHALTPQQPSLEEKLKNVDLNPVAEPPAQLIQPSEKKFNNFFKESQMNISLPLKYDDEVHLAVPGAPAA
ncbi:MAG: hypothetical protein WBE18_07260 [Gammaproteobacteria bacterium]